MYESMQSSENTFRGLKKMLRDCLRSIQYCPDW